jgi:hypothetical protein
LDGRLVDGNSGARAVENDGAKLGAVISLGIGIEGDVGTVASGGVMAAIAGASLGSVNPPPAGGCV